MEVKRTNHIYYSIESVAKTKNANIFFVEDIIKKSIFDYLKCMLYEIKFNFQFTLSSILNVCFL